MAQLHSFMGRCFHLVDALTRPAAAITDPAERHKMQLLSGLLLFFAPTALLTNILPLILTPAKYNDSTLLISTTTAALAVVFYVLSRTRHYQLTVLLTLSLSYLIILFAFLTDPSERDVLYIFILVLVGSVILSLRGLVIMIVLVISGVALMVWYAPGSIDSESYYRSVLFLLLASALIVITTIYQRYLERLRQRQVIENEARLSLLMNQLPGILWTTDRQMCFTSFSGAGLSNLPIQPESLIGQQVDVLFINSESKEHALDAHRRALTGQVVKYESSFSHRAQEYSIEPLHDGENRIIGTIGLAVDITSRKQAEQHKADLDAEKERMQLLAEFVENASHDLKTPLATINTSLYILRKTSDIEKREMHLTTIEKQVRRLTKIVEGLLLLSRLDRGYLFSFKQVDINRLLHNLVIKSDNLIRAKELTIHLDYERDLPIVLADERELDRVFSNLLLNAVQHTLAGGTITLQTEYDESSVLVTVKDTGFGIPPEELPNIFNRFYRTERARPSDTGTAGLGLAIAKKIVEAHGGKIEAQSVVGKGTTFTVTLPAVNFLSKAERDTTPVEIPSPQNSAAETLVK